MQFKILLGILLISTDLILYHITAFSTKPVISPSKDVTTATTVTIQEIQESQEQKARNFHDNKAFNALFISVPERKQPTFIHDIGNRPKDFPAGAILRLGPNGADKSDGFLDGDGLLHCITIPPDVNSPLIYSSAYIETKGRRLEQERGGKFVGSLGAAPHGLPLLWSIAKNIVRFQIGTKDTCNTALAESGGRLLALMEQAPPSEIEITKQGTVRTIEAKTNLQGAIPPNDPLTGGTLGAHGKTCPETGERIHVSYGSSAKPFARIDVFDKGWKLKRTIDVDDLSCPVMIHDCAITKNYVLVLDFPLTIKPLRMLRNKFPVEYDPGNGARIGVFSRNADHDGEVKKWFDCKPGVILHTVNAFETKDDKLVLHVLRSEPKTNGSYITSYTTSFLYEYILDMKDGKVIREGCLNPYELVEFPMIDSRYTGRAVKDCYAVGVKSIGGPLKMYKTPMEGILIDRIVKFSLIDDDDDDDRKGVTKGDVLGRFQFPKGWYGITEPTIIPKVGDSTGSCYMVVIGTHVPDGDLPSEDLIANGKILKSRVFVVDGDDMDGDPVWTFDLPYHLPYGLHSGFVDWEYLK